MATAILETSAMVDWETFHAANREAFGFPDFHGRNMNAWIDCLTYLDEDDRMTPFSLNPGETLTVEMRGAEEFAQRAPEQALALMEWDGVREHIEDGKRPMLMLVFV